MYVGFSHFFNIDFTFFVFQVFNIDFTYVVFQVFNIALLMFAYWHTWYNDSVCDFSNCFSDSLSTLYYNNQHSNNTNRSTDIHLDTNSNTQL